MFTVSMQHQIWSSSQWIYSIRYGRVITRYVRVYSKYTALDMVGVYSKYTVSDMAEFTVSIQDKTPVLPIFINDIQHQIYKIFTYLPIPGCVHQTTVTCNTNLCTCSPITDIYSEYTSSDKCICIPETKMFTKSLRVCKQPIIVCLFK